MAPGALVDGDYQTYMNETAMGDEGIYIKHTARGLVSLSVKATNNRVSIVA